MGQAIGGVLLGIILFIGAFPLLTWNEGRAIKRAKTIEVGAKSVVSIEASPIEAANDGKLVHFSGDTVIDGNPVDDRLGVSAEAVKLLRNVEMYQWSQDSTSKTRTKVGGGEETVTTYTYAKIWSSSSINSAEFAEPAGHENSIPMPFDSATFTADHITVGEFTLPNSLIEMIDDYEDLTIREMPADLASSIGETVQLSGGGFYLGENQSVPALGDVRVTYRKVPPGPVSIMAAQHRDTLEPYRVDRQGEFLLLQTGTVSADAMFESERQANAMMTWLLRLGGFLLMVFGLVLIMAPLKVFADVIPFVGSIVGAGTGLIAFLVSLPLSLITIAVAWVAFRPLVGIPILVVGLASIVGAVWILRKKREPAAV